MKHTRVLVTSLIAMMTVAAARATPVPTVSFVLVGKEHHYTQTNTSTLVENATGTWVFTTQVEGSNLSGYPATFTSPGGTGSTGVMTYVSGDNQWKTTASFDGAGAPGQALLDGAYNNGTYHITVDGATIAPVLDGNLYPNTPLATVSAGTWSGNVLLINPGQALTITTNAFAGWSNDHVGIEVNGSAYSNNIETFTADTLELTIPAGVFVTGQTYTVDLNFDKITNGLQAITGTSSSVLNGGSLAELYTATTQFTIQVIPEPSTFAMIFGGVALAGAVWQRRRRVV